MEVYLLDVGQGTCQILLLGNRRAIVVDCGVKSDRLPVQFLKRYGVEHVSRLIVSRSHGDQSAGRLTSSASTRIESSVSVLFRMTNSWKVGSGRESASS